MKHAPVLRAAINLLDTYGWTKGTLQNPEGRMCALGAIQRAKFGDARKEMNRDERLEMNEIEELLRSCISDERIKCRCAECLTKPIENRVSLHSNSIVSYNDWGESTLDDIKGVINCAIAKDEAGE